MFPGGIGGESGAGKNWRDGVRPEGGKVAPPKSIGASADSGGGLGLRFFGGGGCGFTSAGTGVAAGAAGSFGSGGIASTT